MAATARIRAVCALAATAALASGAAGCGSSSTPTTTSSASQAGYKVPLTESLPSASKAMSHITWALPYGEPTTIDPIKAGDYSPDFMVAQMCDFLLRFTPKWDLTPGLATSWRRPNPRTLVFTIRDGVRFWDGRPLTTADVVYSLKRNLDVAAGSLNQPYYANVSSITATGAQQVTVRFKQADELFLKEMATGSGAVVEQAFTKRVGDTKLGTPQGGLMCSGPYKLVTWTPGSDIQLEANPNYWDSQLHPKIGRITVQFLSESSTLTSALVSGSVAGAYGVPATSIPALQNASGGSLYYGPSTQQLGIYSARNGGLMADAPIRKALSLALDRQAIAEKVYYGAAIPNQAIVSDTHEPEAENVYLQGWKTLPSVQPDLAQAKRLIASVPNHTQPIIIAAPAGDQATLDVGALVQSAGKALGLHVEIRPLQPLDLSNFYYKPSYRRGFDGVLSVSFSDHPDPLNFLPYVVYPSAFFNYSGWNSPEAVKLTDQARATLDPTARAKLLMQVLRLEADQRVTIPLLGLANISFIAKNLGGAPTSFAYLWMPDFAYMGGK